MRDNYLTQMRMILKSKEWMMKKDSLILPKLAQAVKFEILLLEVQVKVLEASP